MKCIYHNNVEAEFVCSVCGQPICRECSGVMNGKTVCRACGHKMQYNYQQSGKNDGINEFLFFIYLILPGLRHMYAGFMKRGLQFLASFFGLIALSTVMNGFDGIIVPLIMIVWFYSAFDSYNLRKLKYKGEKVEDKPLLDEYGFSGLKAFFLKHRTLAGVLIIIMGVYLLLRQVQLYNWYFRIVPEFIFNIADFSVSIIIPALFITGGVFLMTRAGRNKPAED